jgi:hypothetical protein
VPRLRTPTARAAAQGKRVCSAPGNADGMVQQPWDSASRGRAARGSRRRLACLDAAPAARRRPGRTGGGGTAALSGGGVSRERAARSGGGLGDARAARSQNAPALGCAHESSPVRPSAPSQSRRHDAKRCEAATTLCAARTRRTRRRRPHAREPQPAGRQVVGGIHARHGSAAQQQRVGCRTSCGTRARLAAPRLRVSQGSVRASSLARRQRPAPPRAAAAPQPPPEDGKTRASASARTRRAICSA